MMVTLWWWWLLARSLARLLKGEKRATGEAGRALQREEEEAVAAGEEEEELVKGGGWSERPGMRGKAVTTRSSQLLSLTEKRTFATSAVKFSNSSLPVLKEWLRHSGAGGENGRRPSRRRGERVRQRVTETGTEKEDAWLVDCRANGQAGRQAG